MRQALTSVLLGVVAAAAASVAVIVLAGLLSGSTGNAFALESVGTTGLTVTAFSLVPFLLAVYLAEARRIRGLAYWLVVGAGIALVGFAVARMGEGEQTAETHSFGLFGTLLTAGLVAGWTYWRTVGHQSGGVAAAIEKAGEVPLGPGLSSGRCRVCTASALAIGVVPLVLIAWVLIHPSATSTLSDRIQAQAAQDARGRLDGAGLSYLSVTFDNGVATVAGAVPRGTTVGAAFAKAQTALAPMMGMPGVAGRFENEISEAKDAATRL